MSYALRTTLLLGAFWLLIFFAGIYQVHFRMSTQEENLVVREKETREELETSELLVMSLPAIQEELRLSQERWANRDKVIPQSEASHTTYDYFDKIVRKQRTTLNFDYLATERWDSSGIQFANYTLSGEARFIDLYRFIWYIEYLPRYIGINSMELAESSLDERGSSVAKRWVKFNINFTAVAAEMEGFAEVDRNVKVRPPVDSHDPFKMPRKSKPKIPANKRGLVNVFSSTLRALTPTQAYLIDQNGALKILELGDNVYLGNLVDIKPDKNTAIFDLSKLYPPRKVTLKIDTGK